MVSEDQVGEPVGKQVPTWVWIGCGVLLLFGCGGGIAFVALGFFLTPQVGFAIEQAEVSPCVANLGEIHKAMIMYKTRHGELPDESGVHFLAALYADGMSHTRANAERLSCPAVSWASLTIGHLPWQEWWIDPEAVDGSYTAYAARDMRNFPLRRFPGDGSEPLVACDNDGGMNHVFFTNVLYSDGSVRTLWLDDLINKGVLDPHEGVLVVGPHSPIEDLQKLSLH